MRVSVLLESDFMECPGMREFISTQPQLVGRMYTWLPTSKINVLSFCGKLIAANFCVRQQNRFP